MTIKIAVELDESHREFAEKMVTAGIYTSISDVVQAGIEKMMMRDDMPGDPLTAAANVIRQRMELPKDQWIPWNGENMMDNVRCRLEEKRRS